jgi:hypothetical protein
METVITSHELLTTEHASNAVGITSMVTINNKHVWIYSVLGFHATSINLVT